MLVRNVLLATVLLITAGCKSDVQVTMGDNSGFSFTKVDKQAAKSKCQPAEVKPVLMSASNTYAEDISEESLQRKTFTSFALSLSKYLSIKVSSSSVECLI